MSLLVTWEGDFDELKIVREVAGQVVLLPVSDAAPSVVLTEMDLSIPMWGMLLGEAEKAENNYLKR